MSEKKQDTSAETAMVNAAPLQEFTLQMIPRSQEEPGRLRLGRPVRISSGVSNPVTSSAPEEGTTANGDTEPRQTNLSGS